MTKQTESLKQKPTYDTWKKLANATLARLICFNKRRANEPSKILVEKYRTLTSWQNANAELVGRLSALEKELMQTWVLKNCLLVET